MHDGFNPNKQPRAVSTESSQQMDRDHSEAEIWSKRKTHTQRHMKPPTCVVGMSQHSDGTTWYSHMTSHGPSLSWLGIAGLSGLFTSERDPSLHPGAEAVPVSLTRSPGLCTTEAEVIPIHNNSFKNNFQEEQKDIFMKQLHVQNPFTSAIISP